MLSFGVRLSQIAALLSIVTVLSPALSTAAGDEGIAHDPRVPFVADFFVSPQGNDRWSGRLADPGENDGPFATVARAQQAVRALLPTLNPPRTAAWCSAAGPIISTRRWSSVRRIRERSTPRWFTRRQRARKWSSAADAVSQAAAGARPTAGRPGSWTFPR